MPHYRSRALLVKRGAPPVGVDRRLPLRERATASAASEASSASGPEAPPEDGAPVKEQPPPLPPVGIGNE